MSIVKVIEVLAESNESWEAAARTAISEASKTLDGIQSINVNNFHAVVEHDKIVKYRINANISFFVKE